MRPGLARPYRLYLEIDLAQLNIEDKLSDMTETTDLLIKNDEELDWQRLPLRDELKHRNVGYLGNSLMADMSFYIVSDGVSIPAHKLIVAAGSPVLEKFVHGSGQLVSASPVISVTGISSQGFFEVLRYLYTDTAILNAENACVSRGLVLCQDKRIYERQQCVRCF